MAAFSIIPNLSRFAETTVEFEPSSIVKMVLRCVPEVGGFSVSSVLSPALNDGRGARRCASASPPPFGGGGAFGGGAACSVRAASRGQLPPAAPGRSSPPAVPRDLRDVQATARQRSRDDPDGVGLAGGEGEYPPPARADQQRRWRDTFRQIAGQFSERVVLPGEGDRLLAESRLMIWTLSIRRPARTAGDSNGMPDRA